MAFIRWLNQFLRPYLKDRLRPLLEGVSEAEAVAAAAHGAGGRGAVGIKGLGSHALKSAGTKLNFPAAAASSSKPAHAAGTALLRPRGAADSMLLQQQQSAVLASTNATIQAARRRSKQAAASAAASAASAPTQQQAGKQQQQQQQQQQQPRSVPISEGSSAGSNGAKVEVNAAAGPQQQRFKRCYYVPVMNPLPDLKDKQLAVLDMRLYGIRDMPSLRERPPTLPPSVLNTARLRGLPLFEVRDLVQELEAAVLAEGGQQPLLAAEAFDVGEVQEEQEDDEEDEDEEEPRLRTDSKSC